MSPGEAVPDCPAHLDEAAREKWGFVVGILSGSGVLSVLDVFALSRYCELLVEYERNIAAVRRTGGVIPVKKDGEIIGFETLPQTHLMLRLSEQLGRLEQSFGLNPSARSRIVTNSPKERQRSTTKPFLRIAKQAR